MSERRAVVARVERPTDHLTRFIFDKPVTLNSGDTLKLTWGTEGVELIGEIVEHNADPLADIAIRLTRSNDDLTDIDFMLGEIREVVARYGFKVSQSGTWQSMTASAVAEKEYADGLLKRGEVIDFGTVRADWMVETDLPQPTGFDASDPAQVAVAKLLMALIPVAGELDNDNFYFNHESIFAREVNQVLAAINSPFRYAVTNNGLRLVTTAGVGVQA